MLFKSIALAVLCFSPFLHGAEKLPAPELIAMARAQPNSAEFRDTLRATFKPEALSKGHAVSGIGATFLWALESEANQPQLIVDDEPRGKMRRVHGSNLWFQIVEIKTGEPHLFFFRVGGKQTGLTDIPAYGPDSYPQTGVPEGAVSPKLVHTSKIYPGMVSEYWIYTPPNYDPAIALPVMVWQDGYSVSPRMGPMRLPVVTDNLIHQRKLPPMIHVMISAGTVGEKRMRSIQYDTMDGAYAKYLLEEILPEVEKKHKLRKDAYSRAIAGMSSGAVCAFNVAWNPENQFSRIASYIGSYTAIGWQYGKADPKENLDGGNVYPFRVRKEPRKNLRIWLDDGAEDMEVRDGSWPLQNIQMANSLKMAGYDFHFHFGPGLHSLSSAAASLPEALSWLWRDYDAAKSDSVYQQDETERSKPMFRVRLATRN
ncbi:MAG: alpha/beta hydrolase-fold protein [Bryobacteraceae bacterium]